MTKPISQTAFAKQVGLTRGRIAQLVHQGFPLTPERKVDPEAGRAWLEANLDKDRSRRRKQSASGSLTEARREREAINAQRARLALDREAGKLIDREAAERAMFTRARAERDAWLAWPLRVAADIAAELKVPEDQVRAALQRQVREHLQTLSETAWHGFET